MSAFPYDILRGNGGSLAPGGDGGSEPTSTLRPGRVGLVHDWLPVYAGAERVLEQMIHAYPGSDLFSLIDFIPENQREFSAGEAGHDLVHPVASFRKIEVPLLSTARPGRDRTV